MSISEGEMQEDMGLLQLCAVVALGAAMVLTRAFARWAEE